MKTENASMIVFATLVVTGLVTIQASPDRYSAPEARATAATAEAGSALPSASSLTEQNGPGMRVTFQSCGYAAVALSVSCTNGNTHVANAQLLATGDTSPASCAAKLATACNAVGYRAQQSGDSVTVFGTGITVTAVGPVFTKQDF